MHTTTLQGIGGHPNRHGSFALRAAALVLTLLCGGACELHAPVTRIVDGRAVVGRPVSASAYSAYIRAVHFETAGALDEAARAYAEAAEHDSEGVEARTRLGAVLCRKGDPRRRNAAAWKAFDQAVKIDAAFEPLWTERATCHLRSGETAEAVEAGKRAIALDPDALEPVVVLTTAFERLGRIQEARQWLDGLVARTPTIDAYKVMLAFAVRTRDKVRKQLASDALERAHHHPTDALTGPPGEAGRILDTTLQELDDALLLGDCARAERLAIGLRMPLQIVALRAVAVGRPAWAKEQAELVLKADPSSADARIALAMAGDLLRDEVAVETAFAGAPARLQPPSALGEALLHQWLTWRTGTAPRDPQEGSRGDEREHDALVRRVRRWK